MIKLPLVGPAYKMQSQIISSQNCINWYPQTIEYPNGSRVAALMPTPGLKKVFDGVAASVRCLHVLSNGALLAVIGNKLYHSKANKFELTEIGSISALGTVRAADNGRVALIVNGTYTYSLDLKKLTLERLSGSAIPRSTHVEFLDGRFVMNKVNTGQFHWSDLYSTKVNALSYATAESTPDNVTAIIKFNSTELWLFGSQSVERYYGTGSANAPYARLSGGAMSFGCLAPDSIVALSTGVIWLGVSDFGGSQIVMSAGGVPDRISTHALEEEIASFSKTSDAMAYAYQSEGHVFYVISFPSANVTFCFDVSTGLWHQRSFANPQGLHERHRSQHHAFYNNMHIVGDYRNGKLYQLDNNIFTDDGELILRERTAQAVITDQKLTRFNSLQIICETGFFGGAKKVDPQPPQISCLGATPSFKWAYAVKEGTSHAIALKTYVDGVQRDIFGDPPQWLTREILDEMPAGEVAEGFYTANGVYKFSNTDSVPHRLEFVILNPDLFRSVVSDNPTLIQLTAKLGEHVGVCLSESTVSPISCDGATPTLWMRCSGNWDFYLNDEYILNGVPNDFTYWIRNNKQDELWADWDGLLGLNLLDLSKTFRFRMVPVTGASYTPPTDNPTFMELENGDLVWCLAKGTPQISCDGATDHINFPFRTNCEIFIDGDFAGVQWYSSELWAHHGIKLDPLADNWLMLSNLTANNIRVKIVVTGEPDYGIPEDNPTFHDDNGTLTFCLAPKEPDYDIRYFANGNWNYELTGPNVAANSDRNNNFRLSSTRLEINQSVKAVGSSAFASWSNLTALELSEGLETIWYYAFQQNQSLLNVKIPNSVTAIWDYAFHNCTSLTLLDIGENLSNIPNWCFSNLNQLNTLIFRNPTVPTLAEFAFGNGGSGGTNPQNIYAPDGSVAQYQQLLQYVFSNVNVKPLSQYPG